ncbi:PRAF1, partial [Symbiodinium microadriaticum]
METSDKSGKTDPYADLEAMQQKKKSDENLISFGALDEFDPVAHQWAQANKAASSSSAPQAGDFDPNAASAQKAAKGNDGDLLGLGGAPSAPVDTEDSDKKMIYVYHKGEKNCVGWYSDMQPIDIKEAILCACDAIMDGGFVLREVQIEDEEEKTEPKEDGRVFEFEEFDQLRNGQTYIIEAAGEREDLKKITGDRFRRLKVQIDPMLHVEAVKAIDRMRRGANLLKHTHYGFPHLRQFQLSDDKRRLIWYSGAKRKEDSMVNLEEVVEIKLGQQTPVFLHYRLPMLEHLSFSIVYGPKGSKTLDLTCKDEFEFDHWVTGLKAIFYACKNKQISKEALLAHSKRFQKALEKNNVGIKLTKLPEVKEKGHVGLDDCIEIVTHTPQQLDTKMERLRERLKTMSQQVSRLDHHSAAEMEVDLSLLTGQGPAYASVFVQDEDAQDEEMEIRRMHELVEQTTQVLQQARNELIALNQRQRSESSGTNTEAKAKKKETAACKHIDQLLWKAEVDLENVEDMYLRHIDNQKDTYSLADFNQTVSRTFSDLEESLNTQLDSIKSYFF